MNIGDYSRYQITLEQFNNLFTDNVNLNILESLGESGADGNLDSIDMLHNIALRHDEVGERAENILFDLFSGKKKGKVGIDEDIQQASLKLYLMAHNSKAINNEDMTKCSSSSKILYIAGSAITNMSQRLDVSDIFRKRELAQSALEQFDNADLWSSDRMLNTDEINISMRNMVQHSDNYSFNFPIGLIEPIRQSNLLSEQIIEKMKHCDIFDKVELFPVNTGGHWVLFVLHSDQPMHEKKCVVFNTIGELTKETEKDLMISARLSGVSEQNIKFINADMQHNVPNGCGMFVIMATQFLSRNPDKNLEESLSEFVKYFKKLSVTEQSLFNIQARRQIYGYTIM